MKARDLRLTTAGKEKDAEYLAFEDKFKVKLTTDDCYTPPAVYDAVLDFVGTITDLTGREVVRPFFLGGNYKDTTQYPDRCIVVDNPPFSIISQIIRWYCARGQEFFLFAPALTLFSAPDCDLTYILTDSEVVYENGAKVQTGFITNLPSDVRIWLCPELKTAVKEAQKTEDKTKRGFVYPDNIVTSATLKTIVKRGIELKIGKRSCHYIADSESAKRQGRGLYGGGFILSERAAAERAAAERAAAERAAAERAAAERAAAERAAAERAAATKLLLTPKEKYLIAYLNKQEKES